MFFLMIGTVGAVECDNLPLGSGMIRAFAFMGLWVLFSWLAGAFEPTTERSEPLEISTEDTDARSSGTSCQGHDPNKVRKVAARKAAGTSIEERPAEIDSRDEVGHWEMDCVVGKRGTKKTLLVLTERKTRKEIIIPMKDQTTGSVVAALDRLERKYGSLFSKVFQTITVDNGSEFADAAGIEKSCRRNGNRTKVYYCHPYSSYERGSNECLNKMIRRWFPKGTDFRKITKAAIQAVEDWMNNYPREILGFRTADAVFAECAAALV